jgi:hypothetical protein
MLSAQMGIAHHHVHARPIPQFPQHMQRCARLNMPGGPGMAQIMPAKIPNARSF